MTFDAEPSSSDTRATVSSCCASVFLFFFSRVVLLLVVHSSLSWFLSFVIDESCVLVLRWTGSRRAGPESNPFAAAPLSRGLRVLLGCRLFHQTHLLFPVMMTSCPTASILTVSGPPPPKYEISHCTRIVWTRELKIAHFYLVDIHRSSREYLTSHLGKKRKIKNFFFFYFKNFYFKN